METLCIPLVEWKYPQLSTSEKVWISKWVSVSVRFVCVFCVKANACLRICVCADRNNEMTSKCPWKVGSSALCGKQRVFFKNAHSELKVVFWGVSAGPFTHSLPPFYTCLPQLFPLFHCALKCPKQVTMATQFDDDDDDDDPPRHPPKKQINSFNIYFQLSPFWKGNRVWWGGGGGLRCDSQSTREQEEQRDGD